MVEQKRAPAHCRRGDAHVSESPRQARLRAPQARVGKMDWPGIAMIHNSHLCVRKARRGHTLEEPAPSEPSSRIERTLNQRMNCLKTVNGK